MGYFRPGFQLSRRIRTKKSSPSIQIVFNLRCFAKRSKSRSSCRNKENQAEKIGLKAYEIYLKFAERGLSPSAGFGIGIERLTRYICGISRIEETRMFAKLPGIIGL
jgi:hypothetical protein